MEVAYPPGLPANSDLDQRTAAMASDEMDIDIDIDLDPIHAGTAFQPGYEQPTFTTPATPETGATPFRDSELNFDNVTPHKIHIRGLDDLTTNDITSFLAEYLPSNAHSRIEWIDDTSANIIFPTPALALKALEQLTSQDLSHASFSNLQLRNAKPCPMRPESKLQVRLALTTDHKRARAYEASRFYMMHPDLDPREQNRKGKTRDSGSEYRGHRYSQDEQRRRRRNDRAQGFDASMYDDYSGVPADLDGRSTYRRHSPSMPSVNSSEEAISPGDRRRERRGDYFRPGARDRSASPRKDDDENAQYSANRRPRRRTPPPPHGFNKRDPIPTHNAGKELFLPKPAMGTALTGGERQDLFPNKELATNLKKALFPSKHHSIHHRRSDAFDAADATADLFANRLAFSNDPAAGEAAKVTTSSYGRLNTEPEMDSAIDDAPADDGLNIRGASKQDPGFAIRGVASDGTRIGVIKELFPDKKGSNSGKELFAEKIQGRGGRRNRAEDMFH